MFLYISFGITSGKIYTFLNVFLNITKQKSSHTEEMCVKESQSGSQRVKQRKRAQDRREREREIDFGVD